MKKISFSLLLILLSVTFAFAQSSVWKITKGENFIYLGGSVHTLRAEDYPLPKEFDTAFDRSDVLVFEADIDEANNPEFIQKMAQFMILPDGKTLKTVLSKKTYELLETKCKELGMPIELMGNFTPFAITNILVIAQIKKLGFTDQGVDIYYLQKAKKEGRKTEFFETIEYQMKLFYDFGMIGDEYMLQSIDDLNTLKDIMPSIINEWRKGTSQTIDKATKEMKEKFPNLYKAIIVDRNKNWLTQIEKYLTTKDVEFIIIGLGHIQGDEGLLKSLKDRGYKVEYAK
ncbi:MAG: TraB/GumN family protein [Campylobacteraceae bacterium]|jgi:uncharacterized protein YbaP (TraB family)|nr:TraB/GumN family protein [Campylobacteraceae bacterium]